MVSVAVAGQAAKPSADGTRVPLLRPGFRPNGTYPVSFVYLHAGTPFLKKGDYQMTLPKMDMPIGIVEWEVLRAGTLHGARGRPAGRRGSPVRQAARRRSGNDGDAEIQTALVACPRHLYSGFRAGHPARLRCSSLKYSRYSQSSRLAGPGAALRNPLYN